MSEKRALLIAPLAIFPVALVFIMTRSLLAGDLRELFVAPISAMLITAIGYPIAVMMGWSLVRAIPRLARASFGVAVCVGVASAEAAFWLFVSPFWERDFSNAFCASLVAVCGFAVGAAFIKIRRCTAPR